MATSAVAANAPSDPIQKLFVDKIREYAQKKSSAGGKLVDATAKTEADLQTELDRVAKIYGGGAGIDMTKFPDFKWQDRRHTSELQSHHDLVCRLLLEKKKKNTTTQKNKKKNKKKKKQ